jgi:hypothetical protein
MAKGRAPVSIVRLSPGLRRDPIKRIDHFLDQFAAPTANWWETLGNPTLTSELKGRLAKGIAAEAAGRGSRSPTGRQKI